MENSLLAAQTAMRGYLLTQEASFQQYYGQARARIPAELAQLVTVATDSSAVRQSVAAIQRDTDQLMFEMAQLSQQPAGPTLSPVAHTLLLYSQGETDRLYADIGALTRHESAVVVDERAAIHTSNVVLPLIAIVAVLLAVAAGVGMSQLFTCGVVTRLRRLEKATDAVERGVVPDEVPTGRDEIGRLGARLVDAAAQLEQRADERDRARSELDYILTASPVVSLRYDVAARRFSYASPNIEAMLGITDAEAVADVNAVMQRFHPESSARLRDALVAGAGRGGQRLQILLRFRRDPSSEDWREAEGVYNVESGPDGGFQGVVAYLIDVSERHAAQRAAQERRFLLESIFHASPDTIVVRDIDGRVVLTSSALAAVIGTADRPAGSPLAATDGAGPDEVPAELSAHDRAVLDDLISRCVAGERHPDPVITTAHPADGVVRTYETRARPVLDQAGHVTGTVTVSRDVTERVRLEQSLRRASVEAERSSEAKSEFLSRMSHELRTPLNAILGFAQLLELDELPEEQASSVDQIQIAGRHLLALINEVLDISRIEAGRLSLSAEPVAVSDVLDEVTTLLAPVAEAAGVQLAVRSDPARALRVRADRKRLLQILLNLGSNAVKYNHRGGLVAFRTVACADGRVRFEVRDTGPGIPPEQQGQLFVPFSRLGAERSAVEGTGVGLALSKQLVELMGGTIGVESTPGHGSAFWVELWASERRAGRGEPGPGPVAPLAPAVSGGTAGPDGGRGEVPGDAPRGRRGPDPVTRAPAVGDHQGIIVLQIEDNASNASLVKQILARREHVRLVSARRGPLRTGARPPAPARPRAPRLAPARPVGRRAALPAQGGAGTSRHQGCRRERRRHAGQDQGHARPRRRGVPDQAGGRRRPPAARGPRNRSRAR